MIFILHLLILQYLACLFFLNLSIFSSMFRRYSQLFSSSSISISTSSSDSFSSSFSSPYLFSSCYFFFSFSLSIVTPSFFINGSLTSSRTIFSLSLSIIVGPFSFNSNGDYSYSDTVTFSV